MRARQTQVPEVYHPSGIVFDKFGDFSLPDNANCLVAAAPGTKIHVFIKYFQINRICRLDNFSVRSGGYLQTAKELYQIFFRVQTKFRA